MNLDDLHVTAENSAQLMGGAQMQEVILPLLGMIFVMGSSKESIVSALTMAYMKGKEQGVAEAGYKADGENQ